MAKPGGKEKKETRAVAKAARRRRPIHFPLLQGRKQDVALIDHGGSVPVISGEPGIGKSALLEIAKHRANERGISVLSMTAVLAESYFTR